VLKIKYKRCNDYHHDAQYKWETKNGIEKLRHDVNLPKAHFRWILVIVILTDSDLKTIQEFVKPFKKHLK
jgi:hypothetical protein